MGKLCERPACSEVASIAFGFDVDRLLVWLAPRDPEGDPMRAGSLCRRHADAMVVPQGWTLDDRREPTPRLFRPAATDTPIEHYVEPDVAEPRPRSRKSGAEAPPVEQLTLDPVQTVADVAGASPGDPDDPDATEAIPWLPTFDEQDDLDGVLSAETPLLARAFRGTDRRR